MTRAVVLKYKISFILRSVLQTFYKEFVGKRCCNRDFGSNSKNLGNRHWRGIFFPPFQDMKSAVITPCSHFFHAGCLKKWLYVQETCPLCHCHLKNSSQLPGLGTEPVPQPHAEAEHNIALQEGTGAPDQERPRGTGMQEGSRDSNECIASRPDSQEGTCEPKEYPLSVKGEACPVEVSPEEEQQK